MTPIYSYTTYGKCIIAGEHTVLRGGKALVVPVLDRNMQFNYFSVSDSGHFTADFEGVAGNELQMVFFSVLEEALTQLGLKRGGLKGHLKITSNLPLGGGLGASAAICVGVAKWLSFLGFIDEEQLFHFATQLENLFHGESSGVDIAVSLAGQPIVFDKANGYEIFETMWWPNWYLTYSGKRGVTSECVKKVQKLFHNEPSKAEKIDNEMKKSVEEAIHALSLNESEGIPLLQKSMERSMQCFQAWELTEGVLSEKMQKLAALGALSLKPTGSGGGGFVLHFWPKNRIPDIQDIILLRPKN